MDIENMIKEKLELQDEMSSLLTSFCNKYNVCIDNIDTKVIREFGTNKLARLNVNLRIYL